MRSLMRQALWAAVWLVGFGIVLLVALFVAEAVFPSAAAPDPRRPRGGEGAGVAKGIVVTALAAFAARFAADRVVPLRARRPPADK